MKILQTEIPIMITKGIYGKESILGCVGEPSKALLPTPTRWLSTLEHSSLENPFSSEEGACTYAKILRFASESKHPPQLLNRCSA